MTTPDWPFPRADDLPAYAFVTTDAVKKRLREAGADIIDLGLGNPDKATHPDIIGRVKATIDTEKLHRYHPGRGVPELRAALSRWYARRYGFDVDPDRDVLVTMGSKEGISHLCIAMLAPGDVCISPDPAYPIHQGGPRIAGAEVVTYPATSDHPSEEIAKAIKHLAVEGKKPKLVIANYPQNPTGKTITREELGKLVRVVQESGALLLHDMAYADLDFATRYAPSIFDCGIDRKEVQRFAVETFSMSKSYGMPGWRIGFMVGQHRMVDALSHMKAYLDYGSFAPLQLAAAEALDSYDDFVAELRELYRSRATTLCNGLRDAGWGDIPEPSGSMFLWTPLPNKLRHLGSFGATSALIENAHVAPAPGSGFGTLGEGYVRFALIEDPPRLQEACDRIGRFLASDPV